MSDTTNEKKYASPSSLQTFLNNCKKLFATKTELDEVSAQKSQVQIITWEADD